MTNKKTMIVRYFLWFFFLTCLGLSCWVLGFVQNVRREENAAAPEKEIVSARITRGVSERWLQQNISAGSIEVDYSLISFVSSEIGWIYDGTGLYKTIDSGKSWILVRQNKRGISEITSMLFSDSSNGWITVDDRDKDYYSRNSRIKLYRTVNGGKEWDLLLSEEKGTNKPYLFQDKDAVWLVGSRFLGTRPARGEPILVKIGEDGSIADFSREVGKVNFHPSLIEGNFPEIRSLARKGNCLLIKNDVGMFLQSCNEGLEWRVTKKTGGLMGPYADEGWGMALGAEFFWDRDRVEGEPRTLLKFVSDDMQSESKEIILLKYLPIQGFLKTPNEYFLVARTLDQEPPTSKQGFVVQTSDAGKTWQEIFDYEKEIEFAQFFSSDQDIFWILTADGRVIRLEKQLRAY